MKILIRSVLLISFVFLAIIVVASCGRSTAIIEQVYYDQEGFIVFDFNDHNAVAILYLSEFVKEIEYCSASLPVALLNISNKGFIKSIDS